MGGVFVVRQPIFSTHGDVAGYELLYRRTATEAAAGGVGGDVMRADVVVQAVISIGLDQLTAGRSVFMNFTRDMLLARAYTLVPPESVVIQLCEDVEPDDDIEAVCEDLGNSGYTLALDDFGWRPAHRRLLELASIVKINVLDQPPARLDELAQRVAPYDVRLLANRVQTAAVRAMCGGLGYELFQGSYFAHPGMLQQRSLRSDEIAIAQAMSVLRDARTTDAHAEAMFSADVNLSDKLLRMMNSAARGTHGAESIRHAMQLSGRTEMSKWLALWLVSSIAAHRAINRELVHLAVQRGRMCELLAASTGRDRDTSALFLVGLFSLLDAIAGMPLADLAESIALAPQVREALVGRTGPYAQALMLAESYEEGAWTAVRQQATSSGVDASHLGAMYVQSVAWTRDRLLSLARA